MEYTPMDYTDNLAYGNIFGHHSNYLQCVPPCVPHLPAEDRGGLIDPTFPFK